MARVSCDPADGTWFGGRGSWIFFLCDDGGSGMMRVLVCGGRTFENWKVISKELSEIKPTVIIQGGAPGADRLAAKYADVNGIPLVTYPALWSRGKKAGPQRNAFMLEDSRPDIVIAFPGGYGTQDMVNKSKLAGICVVEVQ